MPEPIDEAEQAERWQIYVDSGLSIDDPTAVPGLLSRVSPDMVPVAAIDYHTRRTIGRKIDCAACGHPRNHYRGFLLTFSDGAQALVGIECGERDFFEEGAWGRLRSDLERQKKAALYSRRQAPVLRALRAVQQELRGWERIARPLGEFLREFSSQFPRLCRGLAGSTKRDGRLTRVQLKSVPEVLQDGRMIEREVYVEETIGVIPCPEAFGSAFPSGHFSRLLDALGTIEQTLDDQDAPAPKLASAFNALRGLRADVVELHRSYEKARRLADPAVWDMVAKWGRADPDRVGNYRRSGSRFRHSDENYDYGEVRLLKPEDIPVISIEPILESWPAL